MQESKKFLVPSIFPVACHTDRVGPGSTFVAIKGAQMDGVTFIPEAIHKGATTIVVQQGTVIAHELKEMMHARDICIMYVKNARQSLAQLSAQAADYPANKLTVMGITGTKGKTTTAFLLEHILKHAGYKTALLSTIINRIDSYEEKAELTTAQPDYIHQFLRTCIDRGVTHVVMEVAAQALSLFRVEGILFDGVIFTNFSQEHGEFYSDLTTYFAAKKSIIHHAKKDALVLVNGDDEWIKREIIQDTAWITKNQFFAYHVSRKQVCTEKVHCSYAKQAIEAIYDEQVIQKSPAVSFIINNELFTCPRLMGLFNIYNCVAAVTMASKLGISVSAIQQALHSFSHLPGRLECYRMPNGSFCIIDYAHNPDSYEAVLTLLRSLTERLIVVFGAGGNRDKKKRPLMGYIASRYADAIVLTSDNPRDEDPYHIIQDIQAGIPEQKKVDVFEELDRKFAIERAYKMSNEHAIVVLLGKGPDEYQIVRGIKNYFSERECVMHQGGVRQDSFFDKKEG